MFPVTAQTANIMGLLRNGAAFDRSIIGVAGAHQMTMQSLIGQMQSISVPPDPLTGLGGIDLSSYTERMVPLVQPGGVFQSFSTHAAGHFDALPQRLSLYSNQLNLQRGLAQVNSFLPSLGAEIGANLDLCTGVGTFFNSIMGAGAALLNTIGEALGQIAAAVAAVIAGVTEAAVAALKAVLEPLLGVIESTAAAISGMIASELEALGMALSDMLDFSGAAGLLGVFQHPCAKAVLGTVGTAGLISALNG